MAYAQQPLNPVYNGPFADGEAESVRTLQQSFILSGELGIGERFSLTGAVPLRRADLSEGGGSHFTGAGDLQVGVRQALTDPERRSRVSAVATYGLWLPTGESNGSEGIAENISFTRGAVTAVAGGEISIRAGRASQLFAQFEVQYPTGTDDVDAEVEDPNGLPALTAARYRFGPSRTGSLLYSSPLPGGKVTWVGGVNLRHFGSDRMDVLDDALDGGRGAVTVETRGGTVWRTVGGLVFTVGRRQNVGVLAERLVRADMNGDDVNGEGQLVATTEFVVAWQGTFGTHRHEAGHDDD